MLSDAFAEPGELVGDVYAEIVSFVASEIIPAGRAVELAPDGISIRLPQSLGDVCAPVGITIIPPRRRWVTCFGPGDVVPVLQRGRVHAAWRGNVQSLAGLRLYHSSTVATDRGVFTDAASSTVAGAEVSIAGAGVRVVRVGWAMATTVLVDLNWPSAA